MGHGERQAYTRHYNCVNTNNLSLDDTGKSCLYPAHANLGRGREDAVQPMAHVTACMSALQTRLPRSSSALLQPPHPRQ